MDVQVSLFSVIQPPEVPSTGCQLCVCPFECFVLIDKPRHFLCVKITSANLDIRPFAEVKEEQKIHDGLRGGFFLKLKTNLQDGPPIHLSYKLNL